MLVRMAGRAGVANLMCVEEQPSLLEELLAKYRKRGKAEGHMGELMDVLDPALSSSRRPKTHYRGKPLAPETKPEARTEASKPGSC